MNLIGGIVWTEVSLAACTGVIVAIYFHSKNLAATRLSNSTKMVLDLYRDFQSEAMRKCRREFAANLLDEKLRSNLDLLKDAPVLEFFEGIAYSTKRGVFEERMVWNSFSWYIEPYHQLVSLPTDLIAAARSQGFSTLFREFCWLYDRMRIVTAEEEGKEVEWTGVDLQKFLGDEAGLK